MSDYPESDLNGWAGHDIPESDDDDIKSIEELRRDLVLFLPPDKKLYYMAYRLYQMGWRKNGS